MRIFGLREAIDPSRESIGNCKGFLTAYGSPSTSCLPNLHFQCWMLLQGTLGGDFDIFAASGESTAWVLLWKTRSRPNGVRGCPVAQFGSFSTAFDPRASTVVVFWKEDSERQLPLITHENERRDGTSPPSPPGFTFFDDPDVPLRPRPRGPFDQPRGPYREPQGPPDSPGFPPELPPTPPPSGGERTRAVDQSRERSRPRSPLPDPQLIHIPISDGDDDQPPQTGRQRQRSRSRERSYPHAQVPQEPQVQPLIIQEPVTDPDEDPTVVNPSSSTGVSPPVEQRDRSRRQQRSRSRERTPQQTPPRTPSQSGQQPQPVHLLLENLRLSLWPVRIQMKNQKLWNHRAA